MPILFNTDIAQILNDAMGPEFLTATLTKRVKGIRNANSTQGFVITETDYDCRGFVDSTSSTYFGVSLMRTGDLIVNLLGKSIAGGAVIPEIGDWVTIEGKNGGIHDIRRDPVGAIYMCLVRAPG